MECLPPLDLLLTLDSDFFSALPGVEFFLDDARDPAFNLPTVRDTLPIKVCKKVKIKTKWPNRKGSFKYSSIKTSSKNSAEFKGLGLHFFNLQWIYLHVTTWSTLINTCLTYFGNHRLDLLWALLLHIPGLHFSCPPCWQPEFGLLASVAHHPLLFHLSPKNSVFVDNFT